MSGAEVLAVFGALSSILQVVEFTGNVASHASDVILSHKDASKSNIDAEKLAEEYRLLAATLDGPDATQGDSATDNGVARLSQSCRREAVDLLSRLERLKVSPDAKGVKRLANGAVKVAKAATQRKDIERQRHHLQELNSQLATAILQSLYVNRENRSALINDIVDAVEKSTQTAVEKVLTVSRKQDFIQRRTEDILKSLSFPDMNSRWRSIHDAYKTTYSWALDSDSLGFGKWFREGSGIFWITGKAGSGKSTLLKYLAGHPRTLASLREWRNGGSLIFASYYFWYLGTHLQRSTEGLLRTILHRVLSDSPELAQVAFQGLFEEDTAFTGETQLPYAELDAAFRKFAWQRTTMPRSKLCLMIDGLDEYHGNHGDLIRLVTDLSKSPDIKICISSRPWNAFRNAFEGNVLSLRLEDLTKGDIEGYVSGQLSQRGAYHAEVGLASSEEMQAIIRNIVGRAEGVFLWVYLVVSSVLRGLDEGDDISFLRHRVEAFPADLEEFFQNILDRIDKDYKQQTSQALKLAWLYVHRQKQLRSSFIDYWLIRQHPTGLLNPRFALNLQSSDVDFQRAAVQTRQFVGASCKDLLVLSMIPDSPPRVEFLHRTVYDFLNSDVMQAKMDAGVPEHFKNHEVLHHLELARLKLYVQSDPKTRLFDVRDAARLVLPLMPNAIQPALRYEFVHQFEDLFSSCSLDSADVFQWQSEYLRLEDVNIFTCFVAFGLHRHVKGFVGYMVAGMPRHRLLGSAANVGEKVARERKARIISDRQAADLERERTVPHSGYKELIDGLIQASLGMSTFNHIDVVQIDIDFIDILSQYAKRDPLPQLECPNDECSVDAWESFLRRWSLAVQANRPSTMHHHLADLWRLAQLFLQDEASVYQSFCSCPRVSAAVHHHVWIDAPDFLRANVPVEWLRNVEATRTLVS